MFPTAHAQRVLDILPKPICPDSLSPTSPNNAAPPSWNPHIYQTAPIQNPQNTSKPSARNPMLRPLQVDSSERDVVLVAWFYNRTGTNANLFTSHDQVGVCCGGMESFLLFSLKHELKDPICDHMACHGSSKDLWMARRLVWSVNLQAANHKLISDFFRWMVWSVSLRPAGRKLRSRGVPLDAWP